MDISLIELPNDEPFADGDPAPRLRSALLARDDHGRLAPRLREVAKKKKPLAALVEATKTRAEAGHGVTERAFADAMADLAVTGRASHGRYEREAPAVDDVARRAAAELGRSQDDATVVRHARHVCYRAEWVAEYLGKTAAGRSTMRRNDPEMDAWAKAGLAVSGEDDAPWCPVNVGMTRLSNGLIAVRDVPTAAGTPVTVSTRYAVAGPLDGTTEVVLFLHGHSSRIEEVEDVVRELRKIRDASGRPRYSAIVCDLPGCGYGEHVEHTRIASNDAPGVPILDFLCRFVDLFVKAVMAHHPGFDEVALVAGGSLGGNLSLLLGERRRPWLRRIACWSPGSVWTRSHAVAGLGEVTTRSRMRASERESSRRDYFQQVFHDKVPITRRTQPEHWYRDDWAGKDALIRASTDDRRELYGRAFRRLHWRVAAEQLRFSHFERNVYRRIEVPALLMAGTEDNFPLSEQRAMIVHLATLMKAAGQAGVCLLPTRTGHSIHNERPRWLARTLDSFVQAHG